MINSKLNITTSLCANLCSDLSADLFLGLCQTFLGQFCPAVTVSDEGLQVIHSLQKQWGFITKQSIIQNVCV